MVDEAVRVTEYLDRLIAPQSAEDFVRDVWGRRPLLVPGHTAKWRELFDNDLGVETFEALADLYLKQGQSLIAFLPLDSNQLSHHDFNPQKVSVTSKEDMVRLYAIGSTIVTPYCERYLPKLARVVTRIKADLSFVGDVKCSIWWSRSGSGSGLLPHFDPRINIFKIQVLGTRHWRLASTPQPNIERYAGGGIRPDGVVVLKSLDGTQVIERDPVAMDMELDLSAGDLLYMPSGAWHTTVGSSDDESISVNLSFQDDTFKDFFYKGVIDGLGAPDFAVDVPIAYKTPDGKLPEDVRDRLRAGLRQFADYLTGFSDSDLESLWNRSIAEQRIPQAGLTAQKTIRRPRPDDSFLTAPGAVMRYWIDGDRVTLVSGTQSVFLDKKFRPVCEQLVRVPSVTAKELMVWSGQPWVDVVVLLEELLVKRLLYAKDPWVRL